MTAATVLVCLAAALLASAAMAARHRIVIEAESYNEIKASTRVVSGDSTASGGKYTEYPLRRPHATSENPEIKGDGGYVLFKVSVPEQGNYKLWLRTWWYDACANSFFVIVDDKPAVVAGGDATYRSWQWRDIKQPYALTAGVHTIKVQNREDGARLDEILLANDDRWKPVKAMAETPEYKVSN